MKSFTELFEAPGGAKIYLDMDGVLCNFMKAVKDTTGVEFNDPDLNKMSKGKLKQEIEASGRFWHDMEWMPGGEQLYRYVKSSQPHILSAYANWDKNCKAGKNHWIKTNLMMPKQRINLVKREDKQKYATTDGTSNILIDDYIKNIREWEKAGGIGIHHVDSATTINTLKKHGF